MKKTTTEKIHDPSLSFSPPLAALRELREAARGSKRKVSIAWEREDGNVFRFDVPLPERIAPKAVPGVARLVDRVAKFVLWSAGGWRLRVSGPDAFTKPLVAAYRKGGARDFDVGFFTDLYARPVVAEVVPDGKVPRTRERRVVVKNGVDGNRIGFDLGASDFKISALKRGKVVFSKEFPWDPRNQPDPEYHYSKLSAGLREAAAALGGKVDAIGGSTAGTLVGKRLGPASLIRAVLEKAPDKKETARGIFERVEKDWGVPFEVFNDGDVTALAGAIAMKRTGILGVAMGSSEAAGYIDPDGALTGRISELAFAPVDLDPGAARDEWSGDSGVGAMYFSQQATNYVATAFGMRFPKGEKLPDRLKRLQAAMEAREEVALRVYLLLGRYLANAAAWYREFYDFSNLMILGRVTSGFGGDILLHTARMGLAGISPALAEQVEIFMPDEKARRLGQSVAAAQIPELRRK
ncbi:MAG: ROK family protein [Kiritimatiellae bacterium]|nr:ROK family protein [Kiritimatiellia bacterium]